MKMSKSKAKRLRKNGDTRAPQPKVGRGHIIYSGFGQHENKKRKLLKSIESKELSNG